MSTRKDVFSNIIDELRGFTNNMEKWPNINSDKSIQSYPIKTHNFEVAKRGLKEFSQKTADELQINTVRTDGGFLGLGDHKVTGDELNDRLSVIQKHLIDLNNVNNKAIKEFGQVYDALEALDKDYIQSILISLKATEETSKKIAKTQENLSGVVDNQKITLQVLQNFKKKIDSYQHLKDIDDIWNDYQKHKDEILSIIGSMEDIQSYALDNSEEIDKLKKSIKSIDKKMSQIDGLTSRVSNIWDSLLNISNSIKNICSDIDAEKSKSERQISSLKNTIKNIDNRLVQFDNRLTKVEPLNDALSNLSTSIQHICIDINSLKNRTTEQQENIEKLIEYMDKLSLIHHWKDIDQIWDKVEHHNEKIVSLESQFNKSSDIIQTNRKQVEELVRYKNELSDIVHIQDIDELWNNNIKNAKQLTDLQKQKNDILSLLQTYQSNFENTISDMQEKNNTLVNKLSKKIKFTYWIAGCSLAVAFVEMMIIIF